jgi:deoxyribodipyrimidine photolyase-related protein
MKAATLIFPHQLFEQNPALAPQREVFLVEEFLFFRQYNFHKQKIKFHRATMKFYQSFLEQSGFGVNYIEAQDELSDVRRLVLHLQKQGVCEIHYCEVADNWLEKRLREGAPHNVLQEYAAPLFLSAKPEAAAYFQPRKRFFQTDFYIQQRKKRRILLADDLTPAGGKWSFDVDNRLKYPKNKTPPRIEYPAENAFIKEATEYVARNFFGNYGELSGAFNYPTTFQESKDWLQQFLEIRFNEFGEYEDAIVAGESVLHHSLLTPMLNVGLLTPQEIIEATLAFAADRNISLNSLEGFVRQIIGWREFIRGVYETAGTRQRTTNFWRNKRKIPPSFWTGETGIEPLDIVIKKVLQTGYCHHIERLMVIGNFMVLCEFDPDEVYRWFMELFIDAYDWVMVPNVYGMSQFADGGLMATKPYISGSNYLMKMSDFPKGDWQKIWDGLFWRFLDAHREFFLKNPRLAMLVRSFDKMPPEKRFSHLETAEIYLAGLDSIRA